MKKFLIAATLSLLMLGAQPTYAADECSLGSVVDIVSKFKGSAGDTVSDLLTPAQVNVLFSKRGTPPNMDAGAPVEAYLIKSAAVGMAVVIIGQNGCYVNHLGPAEIAVVNELLGITQAGSGRID